MIRLIHARQTVLICLSLAACGHDSVPLPPGASWTPPAPVAAPAPPVAAPPAPTAPSPASKPAAPELPLADIGKVAAHLVSLVRDAPHDVVDVKREDTLVRVTLQRTGAAEAPVDVSLSPDGTELFEGRLDVAERTQRIASDRELARCLAEKQVRVYLKQGDQASAQQLMEVGMFAERIVIDCTASAENCKTLGVTAFPTLRQGDRSETGLHKREALQDFAGCGKNAGPPQGQPGQAPGQPDQPPPPAPPSPPGGPGPLPAPPGAPAPAGSVQPAQPAVEMGIDELGEIVANLYRMARRTEFDLLAVRREGPVVRVSLQRRNSRETPATVFVTPDGKTLFESAVHVPLQLERLEDDRRFAICLKEHKFTAFVRSGDEASATLVQALGSFASRVAVDCAATAETCSKAGVTTVPTLVQGERKAVGLQGRAWIETFTGCK